MTENKPSLCIAGNWVATPQNAQAQEAPNLPANTVITNPNEVSFLMFRFYGAKPELWTRKWELGSPERVD